jgi:hypothetical protein
MKASYDETNDVLRVYFTTKYDDDVAVPVDEGFVVVGKDGTPIGMEFIAFREMLARWIKPHREPIAKVLAAVRAAATGPRLEPGCTTCDEYREHFERTGSWPSGPRHDAMERCESGKHPHCTCETCF